MTFFEAVHKAQSVLADAGVPDAGSDALLLLQFACGISRSGYYARMTEEMPDPDAYFRLVRRRSDREPLQHITGFQYFMGLKFKVTPAVLIPRMDTEILVSEAKSRLSGTRDVLDLCTGSGCVLLSLLKSGAAALGTGTDISAAALEVARDNADLLNVTGARFVLSDLFENVPGAFDMIVCNPPYIPSGQIDGLMAEVSGHDPRLALDGGPDGLSFYRKIVPRSSGHLKNGGWLLVEIGYDQAKNVASMFDDAEYDNIETVKDLAGHDRVVIGRKKFV